jgi:hypothetical protein
MHIEREWVELSERPIYYLILGKARERLEGWDFLVASHPPQGRTAELFGMLRGPTIRSRLIWMVNDLQVDRLNIPELRL